LTRENIDLAAHLKAYRFKPGQSGNPSGRPRGSRDFAELIAEETRGGAELVEYALKVLRSPKSKAAGKQWAVKYLTERMLGRTPQATDEKRNAFAFFQAITPEQIEASQRMMEALPEGEIEGGQSGNGAG